EAVLAREVHGLDHVGDTRAPGDDARVPVDARIPDPSAGFVVGVSAGHQLPAERRPQRIDTVDTERRTVPALETPTGHQTLSLSERFDVCRPAHRALTCVFASLHPVLGDAGF